MSDRADTAGGDPERGGFGAGQLLIVGFVILVAVALFALGSQRQQGLRASPAGFDGLRMWLVAEGQPAQAFTGGWPLAEDGIGLLVVPLFDTDLKGLREWPQSREELLLQQDEYDMALSVVREKRADVPTLVIMPKWRSGMRLAGVAHPLLLSEAERLDRTVRALTGEAGAATLWSRVPFLEFDGPNGGDLKAQLYAAQLVAAPGCEPIIGDEEAMLLARCPIDGIGNTQDHFLLLSDPDLLNNHGLRLGDNAAIASALLSELADGRDVVIDYSTENWIIPTAVAADRERDWSDLARFFSPPFTLLWAGAVVLLALVLWRAAVRFGPVLDTARGLSASKVRAVAARARLMRLSNQDGAMLGDYARVRIATLGARLFGPAHARNYATEEGFMRYVERQHPAHAADLAAALNNLRTMPHRVSGARALSEVDELERVLERIANDT